MILENRIGVYNYMSLFNKSLFARIALSIILGAGIVFLCMMFFKYDKISSLTLDMQEKYYQTLIEKETLKINKSFMAAQNAIDIFALNTDLQSMNRNATMTALKGFLEKNPDIFGLGISLPEHDTQSKKKLGYSILYAWRDKTSTIKIIDRTDLKKDYASDWYTMPANTKKTYWTEPYFDADPQMNMITYSRPLLHDGKLYAVASCDLTLKRVEDLARGTKLGAHGQGMIISDNGEILMSTQDEVLKNKSLYNLAHTVKNETDRNKILNFAKIIATANSGKVYLDNFMGQKDISLYFQNIDNTNWNVCFLVSDSDILAPIKSLTSNMIMIFGLGIILLLVVAFAIAKSITTPVLKLCEYSGKMADGNLDQAIPENLHRKDEIGYLIKSFETMRLKLKEYIKHIETTTAKQEDRKSVV